MYTRYNIILERLWKPLPISFCRTGKTCLFKSEDIGATITSYKVLPTGDENALQNAVATIGPISVAIDASKPTFHFYRKGVYHSPGYYKVLLKKITV